MNIGRRFLFALHGLTIAATAVGDKAHRSDALASTYEPAVSFGPQISVLPVSVDSASGGVGGRMDDLCFCRNRNYRYSQSLLQLGRSLLFLGSQGGQKPFPTLEPRSIEGSRDKCAIKCAKR